jgi:soluble lytic murein transglycosylase-like protein
LLDLSFNWGYPILFSKNIGAFLLFFAFPAFSQEIVRYNGSDGRTVYSNAEPLYQLPGNAVSTPEIFRTVEAAVEMQATQRMEALIHRVSKKHGIDPELVKAVARVESNYNPYAVSRRGAQGIMQLIPGTARRFGVANTFDVKQNIEGGVKYLKFLMELFPNNLTKILAAYNAGENAVIRYRGVPPYRETQEYVRKISSLYGRKDLFQTARNESDGGIVRYLDDAGRVVYSNLESAYR